jgi:hypothetical protein
MIFKGEFKSDIIINFLNTPEDKIKWMMKLGMIGKEDPTKHIIEYENNKEDDFQDLKDLL